MAGLPPRARRAGVGRRREARRQRRSPRAPRRPQSVASPTRSAKMAVDDLLGGLHPRGRARVAGAHRGRRPRLAPPPRPRLLRAARGRRRRRRPHRGARPWRPVAVHADQRGTRHRGVRRASGRTPRRSGTSGAAAQRSSTLGRVAGAAARLSCRRHDVGVGRAIRIDAVRPLRRGRHQVRIDSEGRHHPHPRPVRRRRPRREQVRLLQHVQPGQAQHHPRPRHVRGVDAAEADRRRRGPGDRQHATRRDGADGSRTPTSSTSSTRRWWWSR